MRAASRRAAAHSADQRAPHRFFFTLDQTTELQNRNTIFGRVAGDTLFNVLALNELEIEPGSERPTYPPVIKSVEVVDNPFEDIVPRITPKERKEQDKAKREMKLERAKQRELAKRKGTKCVFSRDVGCKLQNNQLTKLSSQEQGPSLVRRRARGAGRPAPCEDQVQVVARRAGRPAAVQGSPRRPWNVIHTSAGHGGACEKAQGRR